MTGHPGVYRMLDDQGKIIYIGKAKNLKKRVSSYFSKQSKTKKTSALVSQIKTLEITVTQSETEALLLEQNLIKKHRPPYNILLRDDKSYPFIFVSSAGDYPRIAFHRGLNNRNKSGTYYGPYPSSGAVRETLGLMQKVFKVRQCEDVFYKNRSRPCLQYQIDRCSAPCVGQISEENYQQDLMHTKLFLQGKSIEVTQMLSEKMEAAAQHQDYELAARLRDQIVAVRRVQEQQFVMGSQGDIDVIAASIKPGGASVHVLFIEGGRVLGSKNYFPKVRGDLQEEELLQGFLSQFYLEMGAHRKLPKLVLLSHDLSQVAEELDDKAVEEGQKETQKETPEENEHASSDSGSDESTDESPDDNTGESSDDGQEESYLEVLASAIKKQSNTKIKFQSRVKSEKAAWIELAKKNADQSLQSYLANKQNLVKRFESLQDALSLEDLPRRLECYDISHTMGEATVGSCVVFNSDGPLKSDYRRFNITDVTPGDDYAAMKQVLERRYTRLKRGEGKLPDIIFIDGGKGQLKQASDVLEDLQIEGVTLVGVAKGVTRKPGLEHLWLDQSGGKPCEVEIASDSPALHLIQHIRDESHRFAIAGHRAKRSKNRQQSPLNDIPGVGAKRKKSLINFFGGWREVSRASANDLAKVPGISKALATEIYAHLHD